MRKLALFSGGFALASALLCYGTVMWLYGSVALGVLALFSCLFLRGKRCVGIFCTALGLCAGLLYCHAYRTLVCGPMTVLAETQQPLTLELCEYAAPTSTGGAKATVRVIEPQLRGKAVYYGDERLFSLAPGDRIRDTVKCKDAGFVRDEAVDTFTSRGMFLFLYSGEEPSFERAERSEIRYLPQQLAKRTKATIDGIFPARTAPFMRSLLMGDKSGLRAADSSALSEAGLFHITAVSGLHCGFLLLLVTWVFKAINRRKLAFFAIPILIFYALMTGASPSIVRACIMLSLFLIAPLFYRESD
ncbi:MAG: ComEC/Rec2 family competence protein, partial [Oscillospiraceae bacterium]|nr:ComEC/Rec2 family competence protein [Oscillospiraceae bacterium]